VATDEEWKAKVKQITDPVEMLGCIIENQDFMGYDPYYRDFRQTMLDQAEKIVKEGKSG